MPGQGFYGQEYLATCECMIVANIKLATGVTTSVNCEMVSVTDFNLSDDKITKVAGAIGADKVVDVKASSDDSADIITAVSVNGISAVADATQIDTLVEWVKVVVAVSGAATAADELYAFEFDRNTCLTETKGTGTAEEVTIELVGLTGVDALRGSAAANTLVIA